MGMSEKEWANLAAEQNLDPTTGKKIEPPPPPAWEPPESAWTNSDVVHTLNSLRSIAESLRTIQIILIGWFTAITIILLVK
jgi:hypothetical protein